MDELLRLAAPADLKAAVHDAAIAWCGEKDRETFPEDVAYFKENWRWASGFRDRVMNKLRARSALAADEGEKW